MFKATLSLFLFLLLFTTSHLDSIRLVVNALTASDAMASQHELDTVLNESTEDGKETEDRDDLSDNADDFCFSENPLWVLNTAPTFIFSSHIKFSYTDFSRELLFPPEHA